MSSKIAKKLGGAMPAGRKRTFDKEKALAEAVKVFWEKGYSGASLSDLTEAMQINKPSLYAAFGNKENVFIEAINHYRGQYGAPHFKQLISDDGDLKERVGRFLRSVASMVSDPKLPGGCLIANCTSETGNEELPEEAIRTVLRINGQSTKAFVEFFESEIDKGNVKTDMPAEVLADYMMTLQFGLSAMARGGVQHERLFKVIEAVSGFFI